MKLRTATFCFRLHGLHQAAIAIDKAKGFVTVNFVRRFACLHETTNADSLNVRRMNSFDIPDLARLAAFSFREIPMLLTDFVKLEVGGGGNLPEFRRSAVDEFSAEFDWYR